ncbi:hypothetical protein ISS03_00400 [Patescibacteria group bacterium]|nr:hypothetical protein [Patescibacteria group bacterium]
MHEDFGAAHNPHEQSLAIPPGFKDSFDIDSGETPEAFLERMGSGLDEVNRSLGGGIEETSRGLGEKKDKGIETGTGEQILEAIKKLQQEITFDNKVLMQGAHEFVLEVTTEKIAQNEARIQALQDRLRDLKSERVVAQKSAEELAQEEAFSIMAEEQAAAQIIEEPDLENVHDTVTAEPGQGSVEQVESMVGAVEGGSEVSVEGTPLEKEAQTVTREKTPAEIKNENYQIARDKALKRAEALKNSRPVLNRPVLSATESPAPEAVKQQPVQPVEPPKKAGFFSKLKGWFGRGK